MWQNIKLGLGTLWYVGSYGLGYTLYMDTQLAWYEIAYGIWLAGTLIAIVIAAITCPVLDLLDEHFT